MYFFQVTTRDVPLYVVENGLEFPLAPIRQRRTHFESARSAAGAPLLFKAAADCGSGGGKHPSNQVAAAAPVRSMGQVPPQAAPRLSAAHQPPLPPTLQTTSPMEEDLGGEADLLTSRVVDVDSPSDGAASGRVFVHHFLGGGVFTSKSLMLFFISLFKLLQIQPF